ncbi:MAG: CPBP family intramembrane metalloprotease [Bacteroides sp.]|nr:CPBP family intramembrane metalloprotease [Roseburia sp.]MCM1462457.1 CPBP family intramembrane metalloprotease [Bacteroides sp.]
MEEITLDPTPSLPEYRKTAYKVGVFTAILFFLRVPAGLSISALYALGSGSLSADALYLLHLSISFLFLQLLPALIGAGMFGFFREKGARLKALYRVPERCSRAIGNFPAVYGIGQLVNILTIVVMYLVTANSDLNASLNPVMSLTAPSLSSAWATFVFAALIAPVFEEFAFRGVLLQTLKPYGNGLSILFSGILFGVYHGNLSQCFYATAIGIALGYLANVTGSLVPTTVIHILVNSIASGLLVLLSTPSIQLYLLSGEEGAIPDGDMLLIVFFAVFTISALLLGLTGMIHAFFKLPKILRVPLPKIFTELTNGKKLKMILISVPMTIAFLLLLDLYIPPMLEDFPSMTERLAELFFP